MYPPTAWTVDELTAEIERLTAARDRIREECRWIMAIRAAKLAREQTAIKLRGLKDGELVALNLPPEILVAIEEARAKYGRGGGHNQSAAPERVVVGTSVTK